MAKYVECPNCGSRRIWFDVGRTRWECDFCGWISKNGWKCG